MREGFEQTGNIQQVSTGYFQVASGTTAQRPTANNGMMRYNTNSATFEFYQANAWTNLGSLINVVTSTVAGTEGITVTTTNSIATVGLNLSGLNPLTTSSFSDYIPLANATNNYKITVSNFANVVISAAASTYVAKAGDTMNGALALSAGTVSTPSLTFNSDLDTGIYHFSPNVYSLVSNGVAVATVSNTGFGIGTTTPNYILDVAGSAITTRIGTAGDNIITSSGTGLVFQQTGDIYGLSSLSIFNRNSLNGAMLATTNNIYTLVDLIFSANSGVTQRNIRLEARSSNAKAGVPSLHLGGISPDNPTLAVGDTYMVSNGSIQAPNGNGASPSYTFSNKTNAGMYLLSANAIAVGVSASNAFVVQNNANAPSFIFQSVDGISLPSGTTAQRPLVANAGTMRWNTSLTGNSVLGGWETYDGENWDTISFSNIPGYDGNSSGSLGFVYDISRSKYLSESTHSISISATGTVTNNQYIYPNASFTSDMGTVMPYNGTIVACTAYITNPNKSIKSLSVFTGPVTNSVEQTNIFIFGSSTSTSNYGISNTVVNLDFSAGDNLRFILRQSGGTLANSWTGLNVTVYYKWRI